MKLYAIVVAILLFPLAAHAQEHLDPEDTLFGGSYSRPANDAFLTSVFHDVYSDDTIIRMIDIPSMIATENAVGLRKTGSGFEIIASAPRERLSHYYARHPPTSGQVKIGQDGELEISGAEIEFAPGPKDIPLVNCNLPIETGLAQIIIDDWRAMLMQVRNGSPRRLGADGNEYHFSLKEGAVTMAGQTWSPEQSSAPGMLLNLALAMKQICDRPDGALLARLKDQATALQTRLNGSQQTGGWGSNPSALVGLLALALMLLTYGLERRSPWFVLAFAGACSTAAAYSFLQAAWPIGVMLALWSLVALHRWSKSRVRISAGS
jgi:hypothetical protein